MKKLMLTTALCAAMGVAAYAQDSAEMFRESFDPMAEIRASDFIGQRIYRSEDAVDADAYDGVQEGWDDIGEINDVILTRDGEVAAVLVDIGGFLGIGENQIAVDMDSIRFVADSATADSESDFFLVLNTSRESLEQAPPYQAMDEATANTEGTTAGTEATDTAATDTAATDTAATDTAAETDAATDMAATESTEATAETDATAEMTDATQAERDPIMREGYATAVEEDLTAERLTGAPAYDAADEWIGEVSELLLSDDGRVEALVVDVGGFLGIGEKPVELKLSDVDILRSDESGDVRVYISMTEDQLKAMPDYEG